MANVLKTEKQIAVISALAEGSSIRSIERMTGINRDRVYAWAHDTDDLEHPKRTVTVLHIPPATSPQDAVRVSIASDYRNARES